MTPDELTPGASALTTDELRRELSDASTTSERLRVLASLVTERMNMAIERADPSVEEAINRLDGSLASKPVMLSLFPDDLRESLALLDLFTSHPNMPLPGLGIALLRSTSIMSIGAWFNPNVPLLLMSHPLPEFLGAAERALHDYAPLQKTRSSLASQVASWHEMAQQPDRTDYEQKAIAFARHLASLFGLPWPEP